MGKYDHQAIEEKWQKRWEKDGLYRTDDSSTKPKFYCLDMFPYPSGEGLHVGHWRGYVLSDVISRYQLLNGKNVLHPMGYDAFGLPAENAAIKANSHPKVFTEEAIKNFARQIKQIGTTIDWSREINTSRPEYYKWTQWLFLQLYKNGLAYRKKAPVNWCLGCQTVLANEQVVSGECERCGSQVAKKDLTQWFFKITDYAEDLLKDLDYLDWPERTKTLQKNWIGKSEGVIIKFEILNPKSETNPKSQIQNKKQYIEVFTTRPDTLFGVTFMVLAPEHPVVENIKSQITNIKEVENYISKTKNKSEIERTAADKEKTGVFTGIYAVNPASNEKIPIWIADYVLMGYGTGACMCVPAHDQRDFDFAKKFKLPVKIVVCPNYPAPICPILDKAYEGTGNLIDCEKYTGLKSDVAGNKIIADLNKKELAEFKINFRLRDWLISRQRYWGAPIPIVYCDKCGEVAVPEKDLPVRLPDDVEFKPHGDSPLKQSVEFLKTKCPACGGAAQRETDTMDTFVDSSWYYLRYTDPRNNKALAEQEKVKQWLPVDFYVGGIEHAVLHLLYARFVSKALHRLKIVNFSPTGEPFSKLFNIGMIYLHGKKMSKSKGNIVSPDELIEKYGTDALRGYELFIGPADEDSAWQTLGISGVYRFLEKVWDIFQKAGNEDQKDPIIERTIQTITAEIESVHPNTAVSHLMELFNYLKKQKAVGKENLRKINILLAPFFPHLSEELWERAGNTISIFAASWPKFDQKLASATKITLPIQVNGKTRSIIEIDSQTDEDEIQKTAEQKIAHLLENRKIEKVIYVPCRVINFVIK